MTMTSKPWRIIPVVTAWTLTGALSAAEMGPPGGPPPITVTARSRYIGESELSHTDTKVSWVSGGIGTQVPFPVVGALNGSVGLSVDYFSADFKNFQSFIPNTASPIKHGYEVRFDPGLHYHYSDDWDFFGSVLWQADTADGASLGRSSMWGGAAGAAYQVNPNLNVGFGFAAATRLGYATGYAPFVGVEWQFAPKWHLSLTGDKTEYVSPVVRVSYRINDTWSLYTVGGYETRYFRLDRDSSIPDGTLRYRAGSFQFGAVYKASPWLTITGFTGAQIGQDYKFQTSERGLAGKHKADIAPTVGLRLSSSF